MEYLSDLVVEPKVENGEGLKFKWEISKSTDTYKKEREVIGEELRLVYTATSTRTTDLTNSSSPSRIQIMATSRIHLLLATHHQGSIIPGLLIAERRTECIPTSPTSEGQLVSTKYDGEQKILKNLLKNSKAGVIRGLVDQMFITTSDILGLIETVVWAKTEDGKFAQFKQKDFGAG